MIEQPAILFHFAARRDWADAQCFGSYRAPSLEQEGFIHLATAAQLAGVIDRHLGGRQDLVRLTLDASRLSPHLRYEWSAASQDHYPHVYAPIPVEAVIAVELFDPVSAAHGG